MCAKRPSQIGMQPLGLKPALSLPFNAALKAPLFHGYLHGYFPSSTSRPRPALATRYATKKKRPA